LTFQDSTSFSNPKDVLELSAIESDISNTGSSNVLIWNIDYIDCFNVKYVRFLFLKVSGFWKSWI